MKKSRVVLLVLLISSVSLFLTGCFDMSMVMNIKNTDGEGSAKVTITTPSEKVFEMVKTSAYQEDVIGPDQPDSVESKTHKEGGVYILEIKRDDFRLGNTEVEVNKRGKRITYSLEDILLEGDDSYKEGGNMNYSSWFEGYSYNFTVNLPGRIQKAWWIDSTHQKLEEVKRSYFVDSKLSFEAPMGKLMAEKNKGKWADRWGIIVQTEK